MNVPLARVILFSICAAISFLTPKAYACCTCPAIDVLEISSCNNGHGCFSNYSSTGCNGADRTGCERCSQVQKLCCNCKPYSQATGTLACDQPICGGHPCFVTGLSTSTLRLPDAPTRETYNGSSHQSGFWLSDTLELPNNRGR